MASALVGRPVGAQDAAPATGARYAPRPSASASLQAVAHIVEGQQLGFRTIGRAQLVERAATYDEYTLAVVVAANVAWEITMATPRPLVEMVAIATGDAPRELVLRWRVHGAARRETPVVPRFVLSPVEAQSGR